MGLFQNLFGKKSPSLPPARTGPDIITIFDSFGRELRFPREEWRTKVLPATIQKHWNTPEALFPVLKAALEDGFRREIIPAAQHLHEIAPTPTTTCLWGLVLTQENRLDEAEKLFTDFVATRGEDPYVLATLSRTYEAKNDMPRAQSTLWRSLELEPNQPVALGRLQQLDVATNPALRRVADFPKSWLAQTILAKQALDAKNLSAALDFYRDALSRAPSPVPADLLFSMSGQLGLHNHPAELLLLTEPLYRPDLHGLETGNNLIKAHLAFKHLDAARRILDQLFALNRPAWKNTLEYWDTQLAQARVAATPAPAGPLSIATLTTDAPLWIPAASPLVSLLPEKSPTAPRIAFLGSTATLEQPSPTLQRTLSDAPGRLSRAVPLFLAEQLHLTSTARASALTPWITPPTPGFALIGTPHSDADAAAEARRLATPADFIITTHLLAAQSPWKIDLRLINVFTTRCLATSSISFAPTDIGSGLRELASQLFILLTHENIAAPQPAPAFYQLPPAPHFSAYLLRLEQLLAVRCAALDNVPTTFLNNPREILDGNLQLALALPTNPTPRFLLAQTTLSLSQSHPQIPKEFTEKLHLLQSTHPLPEPYQSLTTQLLNTALSPSNPTP